MTPVQMVPTMNLIVDDSHYESHYTVTACKINMVCMGVRDRFLLQNLELP